MQVGSTSETPDEFCRLPGRRRVSRAAAGSQ